MGTRSGTAAGIQDDGWGRISAQGYFDSLKVSSRSERWIEAGKGNGKGTEREREGKGGRPGMISRY